ncbi:type II toxin-antitoxin system HicB family antitoxin [Breznakiellaceae bacterium SP9]
MELQYTYWQNSGWYLGYLDDYPDHVTQGRNLNELESMLVSLYKDFSEDMEGVKRKGKLVIA